MKISFLWLVILFILLTTYTPRFNFMLNFNLNIQEIQLENNSVVDMDDVKQKLNYLYDENLFFLNTSRIKESLKDINFIQSYAVKKIYPNKIKLSIVEKKPIAILLNKKEKYYISDKGDLINYKKIKIYQDLPTVFGGNDNFFVLYDNLENIKFPIESIKSFYFFESGRWDIVMYDDKIIKLPIKNYLISIKNFMDSKENNNLNNYKTFDYRIKNQLILK